MAIFDIFRKKENRRNRSQATGTPTTTSPATKRPSSAPAKSTSASSRTPTASAPPADDGPPKRPGPAVNGALNELMGKSPEELCGINADMPRGEIKVHLAKLFKRHNRGASSLDDNTRQLAEFMLDAIVEVRSKYLN